jgi:hypothetical protein
MTRAMKRVLCLAAVDEAASGVASERPCRPHGHVQDTPERAQPRRLCGGDGARQPPERAGAELLLQPQQLTPSKEGYRDSTPVPIR